MMGMMALLLILWFGLLVLVPRGVVWFMLFGIGRFLLGPLGIWDSEWVTVLASAICAELGGKSVVMVFLLGLVKAPLSLF